MSLMNPVAAACHADPYPYYQQLLSGPALLFDAPSSLWLASRVQVIHEVLRHPCCLVRPAHEAVPPAIAGGSAGAVFARLARMTDGAGHALSRHALLRWLAAQDLDTVARRTRQSSDAAAIDGADALTAWMIGLPTRVVAGLLGFDDKVLPRIAALVAGFVYCLSPLSNPEQLASADAAADALLDHLARLTPHTAADWPNRQTMLANLLGLLSQTHEATAGLIGNCIVALVRDGALLARLRAAPELAVALVREVMRYDPPVHNTRRFVSEPCVIAGVDLAPGDTLLLLLAAAGRDPSIHRQPDRLLLQRPDNDALGFGHGRHACPGQRLALTIAAAALQTLLATTFSFDLDWTYRPSVNGRLPLFHPMSMKGATI